MSDPEEIAMNHLIELLEKRDFKNKLLAKLNDSIDLPMFNEKTEMKMFKSLYKVILDVLKDVSKKGFGEKK